MPVPNSFLSSLGGGSSTSPTTPDPGPQFVDSASNHTLVQTPVSSTTFLHCEVEDLRDFQVWNMLHMGGLYLFKQLAMGSRHLFQNLLSFGNGYFYICLR